MSNALTRETSPDYHSGVPPSPALKKEKAVESGRTWALWEAWVVSESTCASHSTVTAGTWRSPRGRVSWLRVVLRAYGWPGPPASTRGYSVMRPDPGWPREREGKGNICIKYI